MWELCFVLPVHFVMNIHLYIGKKFIWIELNNELKILDFFLKKTLSDHLNSILYNVYDNYESIGPFNAYFYIFNFLS